MLGANSFIECYHSVGLESIWAWLRVYLKLVYGYLKLVYGCYWHAADTAPLEGLSILRCAIYDPVEGLQISKMRFSEMGV